MPGQLVAGEAWLNGANVLLGVAAVIVLIAIGAAVFHDILQHYRERARAPWRWL